MEREKLIARLNEGNRRYLRGETFGDVSAAVRQETAEHGQHPGAIVIACSDSRVIPEAVFSAGIGELFVIRVAGNVLDNHQLGSIEYAAAHLHCPLILVLGHTGCGAVAAALHGETGGFIRYITDEIRLAIAQEQDADRACELNVEHAVESIRHAFSEPPEIPSAELDIRGAAYALRSAGVRWL